MFKTFTELMIDKGWAREKDRYVKIDGFFKEIASFSKTERSLANALWDRCFMDAKIRVFNNKYGSLAEALSSMTHTKALTDLLLEGHTLEELIDED